MSLEIMHAVLASTTVTLGRWIRPAGNYDLMKTVVYGVNEDPDALLDVFCRGGGYRADDFSRIGGRTGPTKSIRLS